MFFFHQRVPTPKNHRNTSVFWIALAVIFIYTFLMIALSPGEKVGGSTAENRSFAVGVTAPLENKVGKKYICMLQMFRYTYANNTMNIMWKTIFMCARCARKRWFKHIHIGGFRQSTGLYISIMSNSHCGMDDHPLLIDEYSFFLLPNIWVIIAIQSMEWKIRS